MRLKSREKGQALILVAFAAIALFAFAALAIDGSRLYSNKRHAQNTADTAVLAAALASIRCAPPTCDPNNDASKFATAQAAARARATDNGFTDNGTTTIVDVDSCADTSDPDPHTGAPVADTPCKGVQPGKEAEYIRVKIISTIPTTFGRVLGRQTMTSAVEAVARVQGTSATGSAPSHAVVALRPSNCGLCGVGYGTLIVNGSGVYTNSTGATPGACSVDVSQQGGVLKSADGYTMPAGGLLCQPPLGLSNVTGPVKAGSPLTTTYNIPAPNISCSSPGSVSGGTVTHGYFNAQQNFTNQPNYTFSGDYCFRAGVHFDGAVHVNASGARFLIEGGDFSTGGAVNFACSNLMVYVAGGTGIHIGGVSKMNCNGVTLYLKTGNLQWNGASAQVLKAPTASGDYKGLLIYIPASNGSDFTINGVSGTDLVGSIIAPGSGITLKGVSGSAGYNTQIVGAHIDLWGFSNTVINYDPNAQYNPPSSPTIQLTE